MSKFRLLVTTLLVALCTGFSACGGEDEDEVFYYDSVSTPSISYPKFETYYKESANVTCKKITMMTDKVIKLTGIKDKHLWFAIYDKESKAKISEWEDISETDSVIKFHQGYGYYDEAQITYINPHIQKETYGGKILVCDFQYTYSRSDLSSKVETKRLIFEYYGNSKRISLTQGQQSSSFSILDWYKESVFIGNCCYSYAGDTIFVAKRKEPSSISAELVSFEEGIRAWGGNISRHSFKEDKTIWSTPTASFDVPSNARWSYTLLEKSKNIWKYKSDIVYYDGTKKDFTFSIDIDNGKIQ